GVLLEGGGLEPRDPGTPLRVGDRAVCQGRVGAAPPPASLCSSPVRDAVDDERTSFVNRLRRDADARIVGEPSAGEVSLAEEALSAIGVLATSAIWRLRSRVRIPGR